MEISRDIIDAVLAALKAEEYFNQNIELGLPSEARLLAEIASEKACEIDRRRICEWLDSLYQCDGIIEMSAVDLAEAIMRGDHWGKWNGIK